MDYLPSYEEIQDHKVQRKLRKAKTIIMQKEAENNFVSSKPI